MTNREIIEMCRAQSRAWADRHSELDRMEAGLHARSRDAIARSRRLLAATLRLASPALPQQRRSTRRVLSCQIEDRPGGGILIRLEYCRVRKLLLVHFGEAFEPAPLGLLNDLLARFVAVEGTADTIIDVSTAPLTRAARPVIERGLLPSHMPDRRRVFVVGDEVQRELIQIYATYQETIGMPAPAIVRSLAEALMVLGFDTVGFEPWPDDKALL